METENVFKWKHYQPDIILLTVHWYAVQPQLSRFGENDGIKRCILSTYSHYTLGSLIWV